MQLVPIERVTAGAVLGKTLFDESGQVLLRAGIALRQDYIESLKEKGFTRLLIREEGLPVEVEPEEDISPENRIQAFKALRTAYDAIESSVGQIRRDSLNEVSKAFESASIRNLLGSNGPLTQVQAAASSILDEVLTHSTIAGLTSIKSRDTQLYDHSIDVCIIAIMIAGTTYLPSDRLRQLATGCLLHDIGKTFLPKRIHQKEEIIQHTRLGYELLRKSDDPDILAPHVALQHHEHQDGTGLPRGLVGNNLIKRDRTTKTPVPALIGEIAALANAYDRLVSGINMPRPFLPDEALACICRGAGTVFNREIVKMFLRVVPVFPVGIKVMVTSGIYKHFIAVVSHVHKQHLDRPKIIIYQDAAGHPISPTPIDLRAQPDITIRTTMGD